MKKVLITGASGLLGKAVIEKMLEQNDYQLYAVTTDQKKLQQFKGIHIIETDLLQGENCAEIFEKIKPEYMIHLAWDQRKSTFRNDRTNLDWLVVSLNLLQEFSRCGGKRLVYAGTSSEYDDYSGKMEERRESNSMSVYGQCKKAITEVALNYGEKFNLDTAIARYFTIYGEGDSHEFGAIPSTIKSFLKGEKVDCKAPNAIRDYIYVHDAAEATVKILESNYRGIVNVGSGIPHRMRDVFSIIAARLNCTDLLSFGDEDSPGDVLIADTKILKEEVRYRCKIDFESGVEKVIKYWKDIYLV